MPAPLIAALKRVVRGDGVVGEDAAVAPAAYAEAVGVGDSLLDGFVDAGEQVDDLLVAPVGEDGLLVGGVAAVAAAVVHVEHCVAFAGEELPLGGEAVAVLAAGASVNS